MFMRMYGKVVRPLLQLNSCKQSPACWWGVCSDVQKHIYIHTPDYIKSVLFARWKHLSQGRFAPFNFI